MKQAPPGSNALIHESSPYLLQHAGDPVHWHPWGKATLELAARADKPLLVSIGYHACHWCHVMQHESFHDREVAEIMNRYFICVKVDREERPDVDQHFMTALRLMGLPGGWPLHCTALPSGEPFWGGTYFPKETWKALLTEIADYYSTHREQLALHARNLSGGIRDSLQISAGEPRTTLSPDMVRAALERWKHLFDLTSGGHKGAPKFPMPVNLHYLLQYAAVTKEQELLDFVTLTLRRMAMGGIYDQIAGGFARYSVDDQWKVPHYEKMLYDNAQLLSLYAQAFAATGEEAFREVVYGTANFLTEEFRLPDGAFCSSLDADSEGEEGKYYLWSRTELETLLGHDFTLFAHYYGIRETEAVEKTRYLLHRRETDRRFSENHGLTVGDLQKRKEQWNKLLREARRLRVPPAPDDKTIVSWCGLAITGFCRAANACGEPRFAEEAARTARFIAARAVQNDGSLLHTWKKGKPGTGGFLEDYAFVTEGLIHLFSTTGDEAWITLAERLTRYTIRHFLDETAALFRFSPVRSTDMPDSGFPVEDNVIPSPNSVMGANLFLMGRILGKPEYEDLAKKMAEKMTGRFTSLPWAHANWGRLAMLLDGRFSEIVLTGPEAETQAQQFHRLFRPRALVVFGKAPSELPLLKNRFAGDKTLVYLCQNGQCGLPSDQPGEIASGLAP